MKCKNEHRDDARKFPKLPILFKKYQSGGNLHGGGKGPLTLGGNILTKDQQRAAGGAGIRKVGADLMGQTEAVHLLGPVASTCPGQWGSTRHCFQVYSLRLQTFGSEFVWAEDFRLLFIF